MSDNTNSAPQAASQPPKRRGRRAAWTVALVVAAGLTGAVAASAFNHGPGFGPGFGRGFGPGFGHGHHGFMGGSFDPARMEDRADRMVRHMAIELDATSEQQDKLRAIAKAAVKDLVPMREKAQSARQQARELLTQSTIDRVAIEKFRADKIALADAFTKRATQALTEAAEVLTPEQRLKLSERLPSAGGPGHRWNR